MEGSRERTVAILSRLNCSPTQVSYTINMLSRKFFFGSWAEILNFSSGHALSMNERKANVVGIFFYFVGSSQDFQYIFVFSSH